jgi:hypothetical protein
MPQKGKRSPFPRPSLPQAGESLGNEAEELFFNGFVLFFAMGSTLAVVAAVEWFYWWMGKPILPWFWTTFAGVLCGIATVQFFRIRPQLERLWLGRRGEREVGRMLEELRAVGYKVFHDIPGEGTGGRFNVDHALIGPGGVFSLETKTWSRPPAGTGRAEIDYDGERVLIAGMMPDGNPVAQAQACADHLRDILKRTTGRAVNVRPVLLFPGWYVHRRVRDPRTWVLNPKELQGFLRNEPSRLTREDIALYADRVEQHLSPPAVPNEQTAR